MSANTLTLKVDDRAKKLSFGEILTTGSRYQVAVAGGAQACGQAAALYLTNPATGIQAAVAPLTNGAGVLDLNNEAMLKLESTMPFGAVMVFDAVLRSFDRDAQQNVAIGQCMVLASPSGCENPDTGTIVYYRGEPGKSAYELAVEHGFSGTEEEWLGSLKANAAETLEGEEISTGTIATLREAVEKIGRALGATVAALAFMCALPAAGASAQAFSAALGELPLDTAQVVTNVSFAGLATSAELNAITQSIAHVEAKRYAMFVLPINFPTGAWDGFELKASTNNFSSATAEETRLVYYAQSEIADTGRPGEIDRMRIFVSSIGQTPADVRSLVEIGNTISWTNNLDTVVVLVDTSMLERHAEDPSDYWLHSENDNLSWCWLRVGTTSYEKNYHTGSPKWRPVAPARWFRELPAWARRDDD